MTIDVLGTQYEIHLLFREEDELLTDCDGYCDKTSMKIVVVKQDKDCNLGKPEVYMKKVLRHEIIHAFMFESGLHENFKHEEWGHDETQIDWFAAQFPKLLKAFQEADAL